MDVCGLEVLIISPESPDGKFTGAGSEGKAPPPFVGGLVIGPGRMSHVLWRFAGFPTRKKQVCSICIKNSKRELRRY